MPKFFILINTVCALSFSMEPQELNSKKKILTLMSKISRTTPSDLTKSYMESLQTTISWENSIMFQNFIEIFECVSSFDQFSNNVSKILCEVYQMKSPIISLESEILNKLWLLPKTGG